MAGMTAVTGSQFPIAAGDYTAVVTELGAGLRLLAHHGDDVLTSYSPTNCPRRQPGSCSPRGPTGSTAAATSWRAQVTSLT